MTKPACREREVKLLEQIYQSKEAELVAIYGRRRVGKTYLVRQLFENKKMYLEIVGKKREPLRKQLARFAEKLSEVFFEGVPIRTPKNWKQAFELLTQQLNKIPKKTKIVIFFDELPWLAGKRSNLLDELEYYWNAHWVKLPNLKLIVCGSAASWMLDNIINARGGLHNRVTQEILLKPFDLNQTKEFLRSLNLKYTDKQVLDVYLIMGGVAYYLKRLQRSKSLSQNIYNLCFTTEGVLYKEFDRLFQSLFENHQQHIKIIRAMASKRYGIAYDKLTSNTGIQSGGGLTRRLNELIKSGFVKKYTPYGKAESQPFYRVVDEYTIFYLKWIEEFYLENVSAPKNYWALTMKSPSYNSWAGYSFELTCHKNTDRILSALDIDNIRCKFGYWRYMPSSGSGKTGAQVDLVIDRDDGVITLVETKLSINQFVIDKNYARQLANKIQVFAEQIDTDKRIELAIITTRGLKTNIWSEDLIDQAIELTDIM